jgi:hypothetical protein
MIGCGEESEPAVEKKLEAAVQKPKAVASQPDVMKEPRLPEKKRGPQPKSPTASA